MKVSAFLLLFASSICAAVHLQPERDSGGRSSAWPGAAFPDTTFEDVRYVSSGFLESLFGREGSWVPDRQKLVLEDSTGVKWYFTLDNPYMNIGDQVFNLVYPVRRGPEFLYLPLPSLLRVLNQRGFAIAAPGNAAAASIPADAEAGGPAAIRPPSAPGGANILAVDTEGRENGTLVTLTTTGPLDWEGYWVPPHYIMRFQKGRLGADFPLKSKGDGLVKQIITVQEKNLVQVTLDVPRAIDTVEVAYAGETGEYLITVRKKNTKKEAAAAAADKQRAAGKSLGTIIIDPGHGGKDPGAQVKGVDEAQITLAVALELKAVLTGMGYKAVLTREKDVYLSLQERPKFASERGGDLFLSLHCNAIDGSPKRKKSVSGFIAYILREGESEEDKALARRENQAISEESGKNGKGEISPVEWILLEHQLNIYSKESEGFAEQIVKEFGGFEIGKYSTGAGQAGFFVLVGAYMPAVLFEMGFLTNDRDRSTLNSEKGRKHISRRLANAIHKYRQIQAGGGTAREGGRTIPK